MHTKENRVINFNKIGLIFTLVSTVIITIARIVVTPKLLNATSGAYGTNYGLIILMVISFIAVFVFNFLGNKSVVSIGKMEDKYSKKLGIASGVFGLFLIAASIYDILMWIIFKRVPPPSQAESNGLTVAMILIVFVLAVIAGLFFLWLAMNIINHSLIKDNALAIGAIVPTLWMWFRLVRYVISYASAVRIGESFFDFVTFIFSLLFLFFFSRYLSGIGKRRHPILISCAMATVISSLSNVFSRFILGLMGHYPTGRIEFSSIADLFLGLFALAVVFAFVNSPESKVKAKEEFESATIPDTDKLRKELESDSLFKEFMESRKTKTKTEELEANVSPAKKENDADDDINDKDDSLEN